MNNSVGRFRIGLARGLLAAAFALAVTAIASAQAPPGFEGATLVPKANAQVPLNVDFLDEDGKTVSLGKFFKEGRPVLLIPVYFRCPTICNLTLNGVVKAIQPLKLMPGRDFEIVTFSVDVREGPELAKAKKASYVELLGKPEAAAGWHFLNSSRPAAAKTVCDAIGFGYKLDPKGEQILHQAGIFICTPKGQVSRTVAGVEFDSVMLRDSLTYAAENKIAGGLFGVAIACGFAKYDAETGKYAWAAIAIMRVVGIATVVALGAVIGTLLWRERRHRRGAGCCQDCQCGQTANEPRSGPRDE